MANEVKFWNEAHPSQCGESSDFNIDDFILDATSTNNMYSTYTMNMPTQQVSSQIQSAPATSAPVFNFHSNPMTSSDVWVTIQALDLKESYMKGQSRRKANSQQRILDGEVHFLAKFSHPIQAISVFVERTPEAARILQDTTGRIPLSVIWGERQGLKATFSVDLDSVYETSRGTKVYELSRVKGEERNVFRLVLSFFFTNGMSKDYVTKTFRVKSKTPLPKDGTDENENSFSDDSLSYQSSPENSRKRKRVDGLGAYSPGSMSSGLGSDGASIPEVITDHLEAQTAIIEELRVTKPILSQRGDIAYHFPLCRSLHDEKESLEEGDVIGFFEDPDGKTYIQRLTHFNAKKAKSAGVISRSAYLEAKVPLDDDKKDLDEVVCVIGMVGVKVMGPVSNGERVYASVECPGVAIPQTRVCDVTSHDAFLLGQSMMTIQCKPHDVTHVQCFVSILLSIGSGHVNQAMSELRHHVKEDVRTEVKQVKKRCMMGISKWVVAGLILALLISVLLYQLFAPGTSLRYLRCSQGTLEGQELYYTFTTNDEQLPRVHGLGFTFEVLKKKLDLNFGKIDIEGAHYYLNLDRCAHGGIRPVASTLDGLPMVRGAEIIAVNHNCSTVYYHSDRWQPYDSAKDIVCISSKTAI